MDEGALLKKKAILAEMRMETGNLWYQYQSSPEGLILDKMSTWIDHNYTFEPESSEYPKACFRNQKTGDTEVVQLNFLGDYGEGQDSPIANLYGSLMILGHINEAVIILKSALGANFHEYAAKLIQDKVNGNFDNGTS